ncbi:MAG: T9SS type A sorting domain-containing protein [Bacteroidia bacterium]|nr:T9SS type A sorting domain-containing protein [Bacteroidia bacterium]
MKTVHNKSIAPLVVLLLSLFVFRMEAKSQLVPVPGSLTLPDTIDFNEPVNFTYQVLNQGPFPVITTSLITLIQVNGSMLPDVVISLNGILNIIPPGGILTVPVNNHRASAANNYQDGGANVVVVWPTTPQGGGSGSTDDTTYVKDPATPGSAKRYFSDPEPAFGVYPNPASTHAWLKFVPESTESARLSLIDLSGKVVRQESLDGLIGQSCTHELNLTGLPAGPYFLRLESPSATRIEKLMIE